MGGNEESLVFTCEGEELVGIIHQPKKPSGLGVLLVVGGPQYRVGSHRQFVTLARYLAEQGVTVFRFDYRGMGDSAGPMQDFEQAGADIKAATDVFLEHESNLTSLTLWGLCDAASAICFYASQDARINNLVLLNPWVRTEQGESKVFLKDYYLKRFFSKAFWQKIMSGDVNVMASTKSLSEKVLGVFKKEREPKKQGLLPLPDRVLNSLGKYTHPILFIFSGKDLTAKEFIHLVETDVKGQALMTQANVSRVDLPDSDHTFSRDEWKTQVNVATLGWLKAL